MNDQYGVSKLPVDRATFVPRNRYTLDPSVPGATVFYAQCSDQKRRTATILGSIENPLLMRQAFVRVRYNGRQYKVTGYVSADWIHPEDHPQCDYRFYADPDGKNAVLVFMTGVADVERCECGRFAARDTGYCLSDDCQSIRLDRRARQDNPPFSYVDARLTEMRVR